MYYNFIDVYSHITLNFIKATSFRYLMSVIIFTLVQFSPLPNLHFPSAGLSFLIPVSILLSCFICIFFVYLCVYTYMAFCSYKKFLEPTNKKKNHKMGNIFFLFLSSLSIWYVDFQSHSLSRKLCLSPLEANKIPLCLHVDHVFLIHHLLTVA